MLRSRMISGRWSDNIAETRSRMTSGDNRALNCVARRGLGAAWINRKNCLGRGGCKSLSFVRESFLFWPLRPGPGTGNCSHCHIWIGPGSCVRNITFSIYRAGKIKLSVSRSKGSLVMKQGVLIYNTLEPKCLFWPTAEQKLQHFRWDQWHCRGWPKGDSKCPSVVHCEHAVIDILYLCHFLLRIDIVQTTIEQMGIFLVLSVTLSILLCVRHPLHSVLVTPGAQQLTIGQVCSQPLGLITNNVEIL